MGRRVLSALVIMGSLALGCADNGEEGGDGVRWDLRQPTTVRDLGGDNDDMVSVDAPGGDALVVELLLPGVTYDGSVALATASVSGVHRDSANPLAVTDVILYDQDVTSLDELVSVLRRFESQWGFTTEDCAAVEEFVRDAAQRIEAAGGDLEAVDWGTTFAWTFAGEAVNGVEPQITVRRPPGAFSTYADLRWDPNVAFEGEPIEIAGDDEPPEGAEPSCVPGTS